MNVAAPTIVWIEIGDRADLSDRQARTSAQAWRDTLQRYPDAEVLWSMSGYDDDARELWEIPEAACFVRTWAHHAWIDRFEGMSRMRGEEVEVLTQCGVFGRKLRS